MTSSVTPPYARTTLTSLSTQREQRWLLTSFVAVVALALTACEQTLKVAPEENAPGQVSVLEQAGDAGDTGWWPALAFDRTDQPHLAFCDLTRGVVRYGVRTAHGWQLRTVKIEGAVGKYIAIALDHQDRPGLTFYEQNKEILWYARERQGGGWQLEPIARGHEIGVGSELRYDDDDTPHVFYYLSSGGFVHAWRHGKQGQEKWLTQTLGSSATGYSLRAGVSKQADGYFASFVGLERGVSRLMFAQPTPQGYRVTPLPFERGAGWWSFLGFMGSQPQIVYSVPSQRRLFVARRAAAEWTTSALANQVGGFAAAQGAEDELVIAYEQAGSKIDTTGRLKYLRRAHGRWRHFTVDRAAPVGDQIVVALDSRGRALIAYHARAVHGLKVYDETIASP